LNLLLSVKPKHNQIHNHSLSPGFSRRVYANMAAMKAIKSIILTFAVCTVGCLAMAAPPASTTAPAKGKKLAPKTTEKDGTQLETYRDLIQKAQNLTLQRDRLQTSQVLLRGLQRENRGSAGFRELAKALDELTSVFYTEKAQTAYAAGDSVIEDKPKDAIDHFLEAQRLEDGNVSTLKELARAYLILGDCAKAEVPMKAAESLNPYSGEIHLLRLQALECNKSYDALTSKLATVDPDLEPVERFVKGISMRDLMRRSELKKARALLSTWEAQAAAYPEVQFWRWQISRQGGVVDRGAAVRYLQACQNMTPRKRKSYILDVDLCKGKDAIDTYLRESGLRSSERAEDEE
jgi:hypothetical protein